MDNALASKQALNLSVGVSLTAEQVAALTHDIVWMEDQVINGEHVLVPVLYLANANNRLAPNGALIQGSDVTLIAGTDLTNAGTLRATNNLTATANDNLVNSGLIQAGDRLSLTSTLGDITNRAGGIIAGRDVELTATKGDILNERSVTSHQSAVGDNSWREDFADSAARIEAANDLTLTAGRDVNNIGGVLSSGRDLTINAGRDVNLSSAQLETERSSGSRFSASSITQLGSSTLAGQNLAITAGRDVTAVASTLSAMGNVTLSAQENVTLAAAANERHSYNKSKKITAQEDHVSQQATTVTAGGDVNLVARQGDLTLVSSKVEAGSEAYLYAGNDLNVLAAQDSDYSLYDMKKKGSFGSTKTKRDEVTDVRNIGSEIKAGGDVTLVSEGNQTYQAAKLSSGKDITLDSGGDITFQAVKDLHQESHEKSSSNLAWVSAQGKGTTDETLRQSQLVAQGQLAIRAANKIHIDVKEINGQTVSQTVDAMVKADPNLAWIKQAEAQGDIDWRQVKEIHDSFKYSHSGLGAGAQLVLAIVMAAFVGPAATGALGTAGAGTVVAAAGGAMATGAATNAASSLISNQGNFGGALNDTFSSNALRGYIVSGLTAGLTQGIYSDITQTTTNPITGKVTVNLDSLSGVSRFAANQMLQGGTSAALGKALGLNSSFSDAFKTALFNTIAATSFNAVGNAGLTTGSPEKIALHALVGGVLSKAAGGNFTSGAIAAGANEALTNQLRQAFNQMSPESRDTLLSMASQIVGVLTAATVTNDGTDVARASWVAQNATQYNFFNHGDASDFVVDMNACNGNSRCQQNVWTANGYGKISQENLDEALATAGPVWAKDQLNQIAGGLAALDKLQCTTTACENYKFLLVDRALTSYTKLSEVVGQWEPVLGIIAGMAGILPRGGSRPAGADPIAGSSQINKAYEYWAARKSILDSAPKGGFGPTYRPANSSQLEKILTSYYGSDKSGYRVGNGGLADAVRYEKATGENLSDKGHVQKAIEVSNRLEKFISNADNQPPGKYPYTQRDIDFAKELLRDLNDALKR